VSVHQLTNHQPPTTKHLPVATSRWDCVPRPGPNGPSRGALIVRCGWIKTLAPWRGHIRRDRVRNDLVNKSVSRQGSVPPGLSAQWLSAQCSVLSAQRSAVGRRSCSSDRRHEHTDAPQLDPILPHRDFVKNHQESIGPGASCIRPMCRRFAGGY
jgi:hypothetical protein